MFDKLNRLIQMKRTLENSRPTFLICWASVSLDHPASESTYYVWGFPTF